MLSRSHNIYTQRISTSARSSSPPTDTTPEFRLRHLHTMVTENLRSLHRIGLNYIFKNSRLLVGRLEDENQSTEAWLAKTPLSDDAVEGFETRGWRLYKSAEGSELLKNVSELHPALQAHFVDENSEDFLSKGKEDKLHFLMERYDDVVRGRYKYSEREGGELRAMTSGGMFPRHSVSEPPQSQKPKEAQKRKRDSESPEGSDGENLKDKKRRLGNGDYDDNDDDDEEAPPPYIKKEKTEVDAMDQTPTVTGPAILGLQQHGRPQSQSQDQISASIAELGITEEVPPSDYKPKDQKHDGWGAVKPDPMDVTALAKGLQEDLLGHVKEWILYAGRHGLALAGFKYRLQMATGIGEVLAASRNILQWVNSYCEHIGTMRLIQQQGLVDAGDSGIHVDIVRAHESLVEKYQEKEKELRVVFEEMKQRAETLQAGSNVA